MSDMLDYKCPNCGATVSFDSQTQQMKCNHCQNTFDVETIKEYDEVLKNTPRESMEWADYNENSGTGNWSEDEIRSMRMYNCPTCGGQIVGDENLGSVTCPYCGSNSVLADTFSGMLRPDYVIPFKLDKSAALAALGQFVKKKWLAPKKFKEKSNIDKLMGVYVPFWLFDCDTDASMRYRATRKRTWTDANYIYTKTDYYLVLREGSLDFERVPVDGSKKMDDAYMEAIEPYNYAQMDEFQTAYLAGYSADKYDEDANQSVPRANKRIRSSVCQVFRDTVHGYATVVAESENVRIKQGKISYALLPVWMLNTEYNGKKYMFAMNGQTGKLVGKLPTSKGRFAAFLFGFTALFTGIASVIAYFVA